MAQSQSFLLKQLVCFILLGTFKLLYKGNIMTQVQETVVQSRVNNGYVILGTVKSISVMGDCILMVKGRHTICINLLGYDEHVLGRTYSVI